MLTDLPNDIRIELGKPENKDILDELVDEEYLTRQHWSRATYALGCHGPLCRKREKDRGRARTQARAESKGRTYIPNHDIRKDDRDQLLIKIISWHLHHLAGRRLEERAG